VGEGVATAAAGLELGPEHPETASAAASKKGNSKVFKAFQRTEPG
jgi:hypothetical protein